MTEVRLDSVTFLSVSLLTFSILSNTVALARSAQHTHTLPIPILDIGSSRADKTCGGSDTASDNIQLLSYKPRPQWRQKSLPAFSTTLLKIMAGRSVASLGHLTFSSPGPRPSVCMFMDEPYISLPPAAVAPEQDLRPRSKVASVPIGLETTLMQYSSIGAAKMDNLPTRPR